MDELRLDLIARLRRVAATLQKQQHIVAAALEDGSTPSQLITQCQELQAQYLLGGLALQDAMTFAHREQLHASAGRTSLFEGRMVDVESRSTR